MTRYLKPASSSPDWIRPGRSGLISFRSSSSDSALSRPSRKNSGLKPISSASPAKGTGSDSLASPTSGVCADTSSVPSEKRSRSGAFFCASRPTRRTTSSSSSRLIRSSCSYASGSSCW